MTSMSNRDSGVIWSPSLKEKDSARANGEIID